MNIQIEKTDGEITSVLIDGKPIKKSGLNALKKAQKSRYWKLYGGDQPITAANPFSGDTADLHPFLYSVYEWCLTWYRYYEAGMQPLPVSVYDNMKYIILNADSHAYMTLLD